MRRCGRECAIDNYEPLDQLIDFLGWLHRHDVSPERATQAAACRDALLASLARDGVGRAFGGSKIHRGRLSPGCERCGQGTWSCFFINDGICTANCFFCPLDLKAGRSAPPSTEGLVFEDPAAYVAYLEEFDFQGVAFSGGEPLLSFDRLLAFLTAVKQHFGRQMYVWLYTNGDLLDEDRLARLRDAGLDEIRFNIRARNYRLRPVRLARPYIPAVTVEIPAIPEDYPKVTRCLPELAAIGVDFLNLHQLVANIHNHRVLDRRPYTFLPPAAFREAPVAESELVALRLIRFAVDHQIDLPINYCGHVFKARYQTLANRRRAGPLAVQPHEWLSPAGYVGRLAVPASAPLLDRLRAAAPAARYKHDEPGSELSFHPALLPLLPADLAPTVRYDEATVVAAAGPHTVAEIDLGRRQRLFVDRYPVAGPRHLAPDEAAALAAAFRAGDPLDGRPLPMPADLLPWEDLAAGLQPVAPAASLLAGTAGRG